MQDANWNEIRSMRDLIVEASGDWFERAEVHPENNGFTMTYPDGSQITWTPTISLDAAPREPKEMPVDHGEGER